jgi:hypothetical protein
MLMAALHMLGRHRRCNAMLLLLLLLLLGQTLQFLVWLLG